MIQQTTAIIRQRGQLTVPDEIRESQQWIVPGSVVTITLTKEDEVVIRPYSSQNKFNGDKIWELINRSRAIKGKGKISAVEFLEKDRRFH